MISMLIFGMLSLILMPFLVSLTKTAIHRCAKCLNQVQDNSYFGFSSLDDKLFTWTFGKCGVILTRRTILYCVIVLVGFLSFYVFILVEEATHGHCKYPESALFCQLESNLWHIWQSSTRASRGVSTAPHAATMPSTRTQDRRSASLISVTSEEVWAGTATWPRSITTRTTQCLCLTTQPPSSSKWTWMTTLGPMVPTSASVSVSSD